MGRYPWNVKRRILGDEGHVSNEDAAIAMSQSLPIKQNEFIWDTLVKTTI